MIPPTEPGKNFEVGFLLAIFLKSITFERTILSKIWNSFVQSGDKFSEMTKDILSEWYVYGMVVVF